MSICIISIIFNEGVLFEVMICGVVIVKLHRVLLCISE